MKYAICNEGFENWPWQIICEYVAGLGYTGVEVAPFTIAERAGEISADQRAELRRIAEASGVKILGLHWLLAKTEGFHITHPDVSVRKATAKYLVELIHLCADLGGNIMVFGSPKQRSLLPGVSHDQAMDLAAGTFAPCMPEAAARGVIIAIEPLTSAESDFIQTAEDGRRLVQKMGHPNFRLHLDVKAMSGEAKPIPQIIAESAGQIAHFHVNDPNLQGPGMGKVDHKPIIEALRKVGYDGWLSVEAFDFSPGIEKIAEESIAYLKGIVGG